MTHGDIVFLGIILAFNTISNVCIVVKWLVSLDN